MELTLLRPVRIKSARVDVVAGFGSAAYQQHQPVPVVSDYGMKGQLGIVRSFVNQGVVRLFGTRAVQPDGLVRHLDQQLLALWWLRVTAVHEATAVVQPRDAGESAPEELIGQDFSRTDLEYVPGYPVRTPLVEAVGQVLSVRACSDAAKGNGAVFGQLVGIEQYTTLGVRAFHGVEHV